MSTEFKLPDPAMTSESDWIKKVCDQYHQDRSFDDQALVNYLAACPEAFRGKLIPKLLWVEFELSRSVQVSGIVSESFPEFVSLIKQVREQYLELPKSNDATVAIHQAETGIDSDVTVIKNKPASGSDETLLSDPDLTLSLQEREDSSLKMDRFGDYELLKEIARGGMGVVYLARQTRLNRTVALKMILSGEHASEDDVKRFEVEAEAAANLDHPGIVPIYEIGEQDGKHYFSMAFIEGTSLSAAVAEGPLPVEAAASITKAVADAMSYAHENGVIHRDLKPANILLARQEAQRAGAIHLSPEGISAGWYEPKVTDFGLAKKTEADSELTGTGQILGTPSYMPPEQARGNLDQLGTAADIYSLGAILYCLLTGRPPFQAANVMDTLMQVMEQEPASVRELNPTVPQDIETICLKCLEKNPEKRYESAQALSEELERYLNNEPILARPISSAQRAWRWCCRKPWIAGLSATLLALLLTISVVGPLMAWEQAQLKQQAQENEKEATRLKGIAEAGEKKAKEQATIEAKLREEAEAAKRQVEQEREKIAQLLYSTRISLAWREWLDSNSQRVRQLLVECPEELRGWEWRYLDQLTRAEQLSLFGHTQPKLVRYSPEGNYLITMGAQDGNIKVWDSATGSELQSRQVGQLVSVEPLENADHALVVAGTRVTYLTVKNAQGESYVADQDGVRAVAGVLYDNGEKIAGAYADGSVKLFDRTKATGPRSFFKCPEKLEYDRNPPPVIHPQAKYIAGVDDSKVIVWEILTGTKIFEVQGHVKDVTTLTISPDGKYLATGGGGGSVILTEIETGKHLATFRSHRGSITSLAFSRDSQWLATGSTDRTCRVFNVETQYEWLALRGHTQRIQSVDFHPDGTRLATASLDGSVKVWDIQSRLRFSEPVADQLEAEKVSHLGHVGGVESQIFYGHLAPQFDVRFSPDGKYVATAAIGDSLDDQQIQVWSVEKAEPIASFPVTQGLLNTLTFSADSQYLVVCSGGAGNVERNGSAVVWNIETKEQLHHWDGPPCMLSQPVFNSTGNLLALCYGNLSQGVIRTYSFPDGKLVKEWKVTGERLSSIAFAADDDQLLSASHPGGKIRVWDAREGKQISEFEAFPTGVFRIAVSSKNLLATSNLDGTIGIWNWQEQELLGELQGHNTYAVSLAFNPEGTRLLSGSEDETVKIWDLNSYSELLSFRDHMQVVYGTDWSSDGSAVASVSGDGALILRSAIAEVEKKRDEKWITIFETGR